MSRIKTVAGALAIGLACSASAVVAETRVEKITRQLQAQGYSQIDVKRTWLGRVRIEAYRGGQEREIVINPRTGEILRDYWEDEEDHEVLGKRNREGEDPDAGGRPAETQQSNEGHSEEADDDDDSHDSADDSDDDDGDDDGDDADDD